MDYAITNYADKQGFDKLVTEMAAQATKADGGAFLLQVLKSKGDDFIHKVQAFEDFYLSGSRFEADIKLLDGSIILQEYKSWAKATWSNFGDESSLNQLMGYLKSGNNFEYIANKTKLLNDGIADPEKYVKEQFYKTFKNNANILYDAHPDFFNNLKLKNGKNVSEKNIVTLFEEIDANHSLFNFIKVE